MGKTTDNKAEQGKSAAGAAASGSSSNDQGNLSVALRQEREKSRMLENQLAEMQAGNSTPGATTTQKEGNSLMNGLPKFQLPGEFGLMDEGEKGLLTSSIDQYMQTALGTVVQNLSQQIQDQQLDFQNKQMVNAVTSKYAVYQGDTPFARMAAAELSHRMENDNTKSLDEHARDVAQVMGQIQTGQQGQGSESAQPGQQDTPGAGAAAQPGQLAAGAPGAGTQGAAAQPGAGVPQASGGGAANIAHLNNPEPKVPQSFQEAADQAAAGIAAEAAKRNAAGE